MYTIYALQFWKLEPQAWRAGGESPSLTERNSKEKVWNRERKKTWPQNSSELNRIIFTAIKGSSQSTVVPKLTKHESDYGRISVTTHTRT